MKNPQFSENIIKLRELTEKLDPTPKNNDYIGILKHLKYIVEEGKKDLENTSEMDKKIKCYENMCTTITKLLTNIKF